MVFNSIEPFDKNLNRPGHIRSSSRTYASALAVSVLLVESLTVEHCVHLVVTECVKSAGLNLMIPYGSSFVQCVINGGKLVVLLDFKGRNMTRCSYWEALNILLWEEMFWE